MPTDLTERECQIAEHICERLDPRYRKSIVAAWAILVVFVVGGGITVWQLLEKASSQEEHISLNTTRIVGVEEVVGALKGLNKHESRALFNKLLRNRTARQRKATEGKRGRRGKRGKSASAPHSQTRTVVRSVPQSRARARPPRRLPSAPVSLGEQIRRDTCRQILRQIPDAAGCEGVSP